MKNTIKLTSLLIATCALSVSASAETISILDTSPTGDNASAFTFSSSTVGDTVTISMSKIGDLDGGLGGDDTLTFDLIYKGYTGSTFSVGDVTLGTAVTPIDTGINWVAASFAAGDTLSIELDNISYTSAESTVAFDGFTALRASNYNSTPAGNISYYVGLAGATTVTDDPTFDADLTSNGISPELYFTAAGGPVRLRQLDFQFETSAIPEPGTYALLAGLTGLTYVMFRRRRA
ncbi:MULTISPECIES: PEP-CTERM sorting domain-containing protein [unclassified Lentimonas]|uniref:PEP-CTERM sorting domain-containing protein n=1 Tax=unclassified Lentimonas TaxID=2630993 RepID=UPI0013268C19|nr:MULTISPECIES: PEP-CTERM sorting domain-containing protein [unclassified Lentimonas]CAA6689505.1 Unannotated [Lentimonas sp. CC19]CAA6692518.1 Unannotated [Lentimonas sp. CC10]CAA7069157.1 Unannotated [Lentimonas sp. CC11]